MKLSVPKRVELSAFLFVVAGILSFICFELKQEHTVNRSEINSEISSIDVPTADRVQQTIASVNVGERLIVPPEFEGSVQAENAAIRFENNLDTSISKQDLPKIRLNFSTSAGEIQSTDIVLLARRTLSKTWETTLQLCQKNTSVTDYTSRLDIQSTYLNSNAIAIQHLETFAITTPFGIRKLSENESTEIISTLNTLASQRYQELAAMDASLHKTSF